MIDDQKYKLSDVITDAEMDAFRNRFMSADTLEDEKKVLRDMADKITSFVVDKVAAQVAEKIIADLKL